MNVEIVGRIAFGVDLRVTASEMAAWSAGRIAAFLGGLAQAKAAARGQESAPMTDRELFIRDNALQLVTERDAKIDRLRRELARLSKAVRAHKTRASQAEAKLAKLTLELLNSGATTLSLPSLNAPAPQ